MIKIEVTGNSIPEVADKLLAIGHSLYSKTVLPIANGGTGAQTLEEVTGAKTLEELFTGVAEAAPVDPTPEADTSISKVAETTDQPSSQPSETSPPASASEDEELEVVDLPIDTLDFETVVRPLILKVVTARGKPVMEELLSRFGVAKASMIEPALLPELVGLCNEALGK